MTDATPILTATALAAHVEAMVATHGDMPMLQWDHDTWSTYPVAVGSIERLERPDEVEGPILATSHVGYFWDDEDGTLATASAFAAELRAAAAAHGDLPMYQNDADTRMLLGFPGQEPLVQDGGVVVTPIGYTGR